MKLYGRWKRIYLLQSEHMKTEEIDSCTFPFPSIDFQQLIEELQLGWIRLVTEELLLKNQKRF